MNKNEFITAVHENRLLQKHALAKAAVADVIEAALATIEQVLASGDEVRLVGFGNFYVAKREASKGHNPRTGEAMMLKASRQPKFRAGKLLKDRVNGENN